MSEFWGFETIWKKMCSCGMKSPTNMVELRYIYELALATFRKESPVILELGTGNGSSASVFAQAIMDFQKQTRVITVDNGKSIDTDIAENNFRKLEVSEYVDYINADDNSHLKTYPNNYIDLLYIDSWHNQGHVAETLEIATEKVKKHGIISGHDYCPHEMGVVIAVDKWRSENKEVLIGWGLVESVWWTVRI